MDSIHNNPVMNVFIYLLSVISETKSRSMEQNLKDSSGKFNSYTVHGDAYVLLQ